MRPISKASPSGTAWPRTGEAFSWTGLSANPVVSINIVSIECNNVWGNEIDYRFLSACDTLGLGNFSSDPVFCNVQGDDYRLDAGSPAVTGGPNECGLVGALPVGCSVPVEIMTWGQLKAKY